MTEPKRLLHELPKETVRLLGSSQVITSVFSVVKELIENSLDAGATSLELRLENYGLDKIELRDNGAGILASDISFVAKKYHTSKITSFSDLEDLVTYGFRGEALGSLCNVSNLSITTRTKEEEVSTTYNFNHQGQITSSRPSHLGIGTTITAVNLFKNLPVRRQFYNTNKKKKDELKHIEDLLLSYGIVSPTVRISLRHNKDIIWQKNQVKDVKTAILETLGKDVSSSLQRKELSLEIPKVAMELYLPSPGCDWTSVTRSTSDRGFVFVNHRPVQQKEVEKMIRSHLGLEKGRHPVFIASIVIPPSDMDVNVEPNKTRVFLHRQEAILELLESYLIEAYDQNKLSNKENHISLNTDPLPVEKEAEESSPITKNIHNNSETEVNTDSLVKTEHRVKVITQGDMSLIDTSLPVFRITLEQEEVQNESRAPFVVEDLPCLPMTLNHTTNHEQEMNNMFKQTCADEKETTKSGVELVETTENLDMPIVPNIVVTPEVTMERLEVKSTAENDDLMEDSLSELLSSWPEKADSKSVSSVSSDRVSCDNQSSIPSGEQWSRGQGLKSSSGKAIEPVTILNHGKRPLSPERGASPPPKRRSMEMSFDESKTFSTPGKENAFKLFAKITTPKVMTANPECSDSRISEILMESWDNLSASEKTTYELKAGAQSLEKGGHKSVANHSLKNKMQKGNLNTSGLSSTPSIKEQLMRSTNRPRKQQAVPKEEDQRSEKTLPFSISKLRKTFSSHPSESSLMASSSCWQLIGPLKSCGMWTCYRDYKIHILNPHRVHETVLYHRLMNEHVLPSEALERPVKITQEVLGNLWEPFKNLAIQHNTTQMYSILQDRRFTSNGIQIKLFFDAESEIQAEISALPACIPTYGIEDVKEILELIYSTGTDYVAGSRPLKVINYLKSEAVRMARQLPRQQDYDDMVDLLCQVEELLPKGCNSCLHDKLFLHALFDLNNIPLTQYSQEEN